MGIAYNSSIVTSGLVLALDAANTKNYNLTAVEVLVVAGGGGGGGSTAGGGGGGGVIYNSNFNVTPGSAVTVTVGAGGQGTVRSDQGAPTNTSGGNSVFGALTAIGGGRGYSGSDTYTPRTSAVGGSGGGGGYYSGGLDPKGSGTSSAGTAGQGFAGGDGAAIGEWGGGGGGGAGGAGGAQVANNSLRIGGPGLGFNISGTFQYYGGGGGGGCYLSGFSLGGIGGGGNGGDGNAYVPTAGTTNTGGGGGGGGYYQFGPGGGAGGSGIVIVRYQGPQKAIGGTITSNNGYTIHTFTTVESTTFTPLVATNNSAILGLSDFSGGGNFATSVNGPTYSSANGGSIVFDGSNDGVQLSGTNLSLNQMTISSWNFSSNYNQNGFMFEKTTNGSVNTQYSLFYNGSNEIYYETFGLSPTALTVNTTTAGVINNQWNNVVATFDGTIKRIYVNGILRATSATLSGTVTQNTTGAAFIGIYGNFGGYPFNGRISNTSIYNRALTAAEVSQNYNALKGRFTPDGSLSNPFLSPVQAQSLAISAGTYYFKSGAMSSAQLLEYQPNYYESRPFCCVFRSPYRSTATTNRIDLNIPMGGLLVQRDALDLRAAVYWSTPITYNTVGGAGNNTADSGYSPRRVILGGSGGHGIFATNQQQCNWGSATGAIGAGWDGSTCGSFPNDLVWGTGRSDTATYENRSGTWSHWITWS
jgi:hypothetical protein